MSNTTRDGSLGVFFFAFLLFSITFQNGCNGGHGGGTNSPPPPPPPPGGFTVGVQTINGNTGMGVGWEGVNQLVGNWNADLSGAVGNIKTFGPYSGATPVSVTGGRRPALWSGSYNDTACPFLSGTQFWSNVPISGSGINVIGACDNPPAGLAIPAFATTDALPATFTVQGSGLTTNNGLPRLQFYGPLLSLFSTLTATSVSSDGTTATFPFPKNTDGTALTAGHYAFTVLNQTAPGVYVDAFGSAFSVGTSDTSHVTPYGVDTADETIVRFSGSTTNTTVQPTAFITLTSSSQVVPLWGGPAVTVGTNPVAIKVYNPANFGRASCGRNGCSGTQYTVPSMAITANFGSNNVSLVQFFNSSSVFTGTVTNLSVGTNPCAIVLSSDHSTAYVADYGSSSVSIVSLTSNAVTGAIAVGPQPAALAIDPSGTSLWVGGLNYISQIDLSSHATLSSVPSVSGQVTSVALSSGQNAVVYTTISTDYSRFAAIQANVSAGTFSATKSGTSSATPFAITGTKTLATADVAGTRYANPNPGGGAPPGYLAPTGALVSVPYGNRYSVIGTPTGFMVQDLQSQTTILSGSTTNPIRGIATDPQNGMIYATVPDSNRLLSIPFTPVP